MLLDMHKHYLLSPANVKAAPNDPAVYLLRHSPSGRFYINYTKSARPRIYWWFNRLSRVEGSGHLPASIKRLIAQIGADPAQWTFALIEMGPHMETGDTDEADHAAKWIERAHRVRPADLFNNVRAPRPAKVSGFTGKQRGMSPRSWLKARMGLADTTTSETLPPHRWAVDPHKLAPTGHPGVSFGLYLFRSCRATPVAGRLNGVQHPSEHAIAELFEIWREANKHDATIKAITTAPRNVVEAASLPAPIDTPLMELTPRAGDVPASRGEGTINAPEPMPPVDNTFVPASLSDEDSVILDRFGL